jgi:hypothetical protein
LALFALLVAVVTGLGVVGSFKELRLVRRGWEELNRLRNS